MNEMNRVDCIKVYGLKSREVISGAMNFLIVFVFKGYFLYFMRDGELYLGFYRILFLLL